MRSNFDLEQIELLTEVEDIRKKGLEPYNYGVYTLADRDPQWGKWEQFIEDLLCKLN